MKSSKAKQNDKEELKKLRKVRKAQNKAKAQN
jgi:hypothetical protein